MKALLRATVWAVLNRVMGEGVEPIASSPAQFRQQIGLESQKWAEVIRAANIKAN